MAVLVLLAGGPAWAQDPTYQQLENVVYAEEHGVGLLMDIFRPTGDANGLGIVDVISGAWHSDRGKIRDHARAQTFQILCRKGYTVFAIRPGSISKFNAPEMIVNLNQGIVWVKQHAETYRVDPERLGMMGASAGGHLACLAAVTAAPEGAHAGGNGDGSTSRSDTRVKAVAVFFPPTDFLNFGGHAVDLEATEGIGPLALQLALPKGTPPPTAEEMTRQITRISPARLVTPQAPPFLLIHGDADPVVPLQQSELMLAALKQAAVPAELVVKQGGGHPWLTLHEEVQLMADWFDQQLLPR
jgi:acetyl esterase/lipase